MYEPDAKNGSRFTVMAASPIYRLYHSVALLLPDASVFVAGSEQTPCNAGCLLKSPPLVQYQAERFLPPYFTDPVLNASRPIITSLNATTGRMGSKITVSFTGQNVTGAVLMASGSVTHQHDMHQRGIELVVSVLMPGVAHVTMPPQGGLVAPPGVYMLFLMNGPVPCVRARWIRLIW